MMIGKILLLYALLLSISYFLQNKLIFFPEKLKAEYSFELTPPDTEINLMTSDDVNINAIFYNRPNNKFVVIYFHGNAGSLASWKTVSKELLDMGCNVLLIDYRGYGKSGGVFSEEGFYHDAEAAYSYVKQLGYSDANIIFYGRSLGTGIAVEMATRHPVKGLILETPFASLPKLAMKHYWYLLPNFLLRYRFDNLKKVSKLTMPVLILHGSADDLIPLSHSETLNQAILTQHRLVIIKNGDHNNLETFREHKKAIQEFLYKDLKS